MRSLHHLTLSLGILPLAISQSGMAGQPPAFDAIEIARPLHQDMTAPAPELSDRVITLASGRQWFASGAVTVDLGLRSIPEVVISFWILPLGTPVTAVPQHTLARSARAGNKAPGVRLQFPETVNLVEAGDFRKNARSLRISTSPSGQVEANHLSWHNKNQWLSGVRSDGGQLVTGRWTHIAYGIGQAGQRLWINGQLIAHNQEGKQSVSWPLTLRFNPSMSVIGHVRIDADDTEVSSAAATPPVLDIQPGGAALHPLAFELLDFIRSAPVREARLAALLRRFPGQAAPYEQARLNILNKLAPLYFLRLLQETVDPAPQGVDLNAFVHGETRWILDTAGEWDARVARLESGQAAPLAVPRIIPDTSLVSVRDGAFWQNGRPIYLVGLQTPRYELTRDLGFSFTGHTVGPSWEFPAADKPARHTGLGQRKRAEEAASYGQFWDILYSGHIFPGWVLEQHPELKVGLGFMRHDMMAKPAWEIHKNTLESVLADLKDVPNLFGFDLANEPAFNGATVDSPDRWRAWLRRRHGTLAELNRAWDSNYAAWDAIPVPDFVNRKHVQPWAQKLPSSSGLELRQYADWSLFNMERVQDWFTRVNRIVKNALPRTFTYTKMTAGTAGHPRMGIDTIANVRMTDLIGTDSWWVFNGLDQNRVGSADLMSGVHSEKTSIYSVNWTPGLMLYDVLSSARPDAPAVNAEFHLFNDSFTGMSAENPDPAPGHWDRPIPPNHFHAGIWQQAVHGQAMSNLWTHWPRNNISERPGALDAASRAAMDLNRLAPEVHALHTTPRPIAILWGRSPVLAHTHGEWRLPIYRQWQTLWEGLTLNGHRPAYLFERDLAAGQRPDPAKTKAILVGYFTHIDAKALETLKAARASGIPIWTVGKDNLTRDPYDRPQPAASLLEPDRVLDAAAFAADPFAETRQTLAAAGLLPDVQVVETGPISTPTRLVHLRTAIHNGSRLVNLCNYARQDLSVAVRITAAPGRNATHAIDLLTGERLSLDNIPLEVEQVRLLQVEASTM
ncbi:glycoside hydrolase family 42 [Opitutaceae bacterium TAV5]|nr:glycoside hydrolase family 42 [Opitutaceae bacterium TAV5]